MFFVVQANYTIPSICCILIFLAFGEDSYTSARNFPPTLLLLFLYGYVFVKSLRIRTLPGLFNYLVSFGKSVPHFISIIKFSVCNLCIVFLLWVR